MRLGEDLVAKYLMEDQQFLEFEANERKKLTCLTHLPSQLLHFATTVDTCRADVMAQVHFTLMFTLLYKLFGPKRARISQFHFSCEL